MTPKGYRSLSKLPGSAILPISPADERKRLKREKETRDAIERELSVRQSVILNLSDLIKSDKRATLFTMSFISFLTRRGIYSTMTSQRLEKETRTRSFASDLISYLRDPATKEDQFMLAITYINSNQALSAVPTNGKLLATRVAEIAVSRKFTMEPTSSQIDEDGPTFAEVVKRSPDQLQQRAEIVSEQQEFEALQARILSAPSGSQSRSDSHVRGRAQSTHRIAVRADSTNSATSSGSKRQSRIFKQGSISKLVLKPAQTIEDKDDDDDEEEKLASDDHESEEEEDEESDPDDDDSDDSEEQDSSPVDESMKRDDEGALDARYLALLESEGMDYITGPMIFNDFRYSRQESEDIEARALERFNENKTNPIRLAQIFRDKPSLYKSIESRAIKYSKEHSVKKLTSRREKELTNAIKARSGTGAYLDMTRTERITSLEDCLVYGLANHRAMELITPDVPQPSRSAKSLIDWYEKHISTYLESKDD